MPDSLRFSASVILLAIFSSGEDALEKIKTEKPDLVISDWNMPQMDGMDLLVELRKTEGFSDLPFICFDVMEDQDGKLYIIESNVMPGVPFDSTVQIYRTLFKDFYGRDVDAITDKKLQELSDKLNKKTLTMDGGKRFFIGDDLK